MGGNGNGSSSSGGTGSSAVLEAVGERIRTRRERLGITQRDVANGLQVSAQAVSKWERGDNAPDVGVLVALSRLLGVSLDWLLGGHAPTDDGGRPQEVFEATVLVADLTGFSRACHELSPRDVATWLNGRLYQITEAILRHDGIVIKALGDALLAFFAGAQHQDRAVRAAFLIRRTTETLTHVGLDTGLVYGGPIGHPDYAHMDVIGQACFAVFDVERMAAKQTESHVAATAEVVQGLTEPVSMSELTVLTMPAFKRTSQVYELHLPPLGNAPSN
jgi:class 3 adenylate cyclase